MFNAQKFVKLEQQYEKIHKKQQQIKQWRKRYKTQIRPALIKRYNRRINGFAKKMEDDPVQVRVVKDGFPDDALKRQFHKGFNAKEIFRFKNSDDWKSIFTPMQRAQREQIMKGSVKDAEGQMLSLRSIYSQSLYGTSKVQFRIRQKQKQINPPMKYTYKTSQLVLNSLPQINKKNKSNSLNFSINLSQSLQQSADRVHSQTVEANRRIRRKNSIFFDDQTLGYNIDNSDPQNLSYTNNHSKRTIVEKTQKQIIEQQQMKALAQNKLYFKSLIDLQQSVTNAKQRNNLKQILVKCKIFKPSSGKTYEEEEVDRFLEMMKTRQ